jgi:peptidyl-prolyl cis-trans isomerase C
MGNPKWTNLREDYRQDLIESALGALIAAELIYQKAAAAGLKATDAEIQAEFTQFARDYASDAEMNLALADRNMDRAALMREMAKTVTIRKFVTENVDKKTVVTPAEVSEYYQKQTEEFRHPELVRTSHILIRVKDGATEEQERLAKQRAETILARVKKGEDFAKLAKENSTDASAKDGGDLGFTPRGQLVPEYEDAAFSLPAGGVSDLVRTQFGYHIIKVTDKKKEGLAPLAEVQQQLTEFLKSQKAQVEVGRFVDQLRSQAKIETYVPIRSSQPAGASTASSPRP